MPPPPPVAPPPATAAEPEGTGALDADQLRRADQFISVFENSTTTIAYGYAENIDDGAGVTTGRAGFTTRTCDALTVVKRYSQQRPGNVLEPFTPELERLCRENSADTSRLPEAAYLAAWQAAAADQTFRDVQDAVVHEEYLSPAMAEADRIGLRTALARAELYDTSIHHGAGGGPMSMQGVVRQTVSRVGLPAQVGERRWLDAYFTVRIEMLLNSGTKKALTTDRVESLRRVASTGNYALKGPITLTAYGDTFTIA